MYGEDFHQPLEELGEVHKIIQPQCNYGPRKGPQE
jgi:hypothetical protein